MSYIRVILFSLAVAMVAVGGFIDSAHAGFGTKSVVRGG